MRNARRIFFIALCCSLCACGGPSLQYKKDVSSMMAKGNFEGAQAKIEKNKNKVYGEHNKLLYYLDLSIPQTAQNKHEDANKTLESAQDAQEDLQVQSVSQNLGTLVINDNTQPYRAPVYEQALTYFYRSLNYLTMQDLQDAAVEARKAAFFLDYTRSHETKTYNDDPFVQYFTSMIFEDTGSLSDARISRDNANNAYQKYLSWYEGKAPAFNLPKDYKDMGEVVIFHLNGKVPYKISNEISLAWDNIWFAVNANNDLKGVSGDVIDAVYAGAFGRSVTISFPELKDNPYIITGSAVEVDGGQPVKTQLVADIAATAKETLKEQNAAIYARTVTRAVTKFILRVQAQNSATKLTKDKNVGALVGALVSAASNITEKADTRSWFTLPAEIRMADLFLPQGTYNIKMLFYDDRGNAIDEYVFEKVQINKGKRTYLYRTTAK